jgi:hypothetical protein
MYRLASASMNNNFKATVNAAAEQYNMFSQMGGLKTVEDVQAYAEITGRLRLPVITAEGMKMGELIGVLKAGGINFTSTTPINTPQIFNIIENNKALKTAYIDSGILTRINDEKGRTVYGVHPYYSAMADMQQMLLINDKGNYSAEEKAEGKGK